jgi:L-evernosamine nitrososynthase
MFELTAKSESGTRLVALAETLADDFATRASMHDREASYAFENVEALKRAGYFAAPIPMEHGGGGVTSVHDVLVASSRLARGDASTAIGVNMHLVAVLNIARRWRMAVASANERRAAAFGRSLESITRDGVVLAAAISERSQDLTRPATFATRTGTGWSISGQKAFCTMSPAADVFYTAVRLNGDDGAELYGYAMIPADAPGVLVHDDWDALGMRASGSNSITFDGVELAAEALRGGFPAGDPIPYMERNLTAGLFHASASLGIAEAAHRVAVAAIANRETDGRSRTLAAENAIELESCRATFARSAELIDEHYAANPTEDGTRDELVALFTEAQATKAYVNDVATRIVDRALTLSGGVGYLNGHPLARAYRDVRAGAFMHPLGANRAYELVAEVALGREPFLH